METSSSKLKGTEGVYPAGSRGELVSEWPESKDGDGGGLAAAPGVSSPVSASLAASPASTPFSCPVSSHRTSLHLPAPISDRVAQGQG